MKKNKVKMVAHASVPSEEGKKIKQTMLAQFIVRGAIFSLFFLGIFIKIPNFLLYLLLPLIIANLVLGFINKKRSIFVNLIFLMFYPLLFVFLIEYLITITGSVIGFFHVLFFALKYFKKDFKKISVKKESVKKK